MNVIRSIGQGVVIPTTRPIATTEPILQMFFFFFFFFFSFLNLNLNGLLVIRQIDNISQEGGGGGECARREFSPWLSQEMPT